MDAYWAKDIQELFRLERRASFQRFVELLLAQSGGIFEATRFAAPCEVSRTTIANYLAALEATSVALVLRPFSTRRSNEIIAAPKVYGFDTGFVCAHRGWTSLRHPRPSRRTHCQQVNRGKSQRRACHSGPCRQRPRIALTNERAPELWMNERMVIIRSSRQPLKIFTGFFISRRQPLDHFIIEPAL
jgi:hypothetical protein